MIPAIYYISGLNVKKDKLKYAYSLRRVVPSYTGAAVQLLKYASDQTTITVKDFSFDIDTGELNQTEILNWLATSPVAYSGRAYVSRWYDQSGNGNTLGVVNSSNGRQPRLVNNNIFYTKEGRIALAFGVDTYNYLVSGTISLPLNNLSMFIVCSNNGAGIAAPIDLGTTKFPRPNQSGNDQFYYAGVNRIALGTTGSLNKIYSSLSTPTNISAWKNNVSLGNPVSIASTLTSTSINIGYLFPNTFNGTIQEMLFYTGDVFDRTTMTRDIIDYYSISVITIPGFTTTAAFNIKADSADSGGDIPIYSEVPTERGILWGTSPELYLSSANRIISGSGFGSYTSSMTVGIAPSSLYYVRAYAIVPSGIAYANIISFNTPSGKPVLSTNSITDILSTSATSGGDITSDEGYPVTSRGVVWSTTSNPTIALPTKTVDGSGSGPFTSFITGLSNEMTYYVRAYAINGKGISYGNQQVFTTTVGNVLKYAYSLRRVVPEYTGPGIMVLKYVYPGPQYVRNFYFDPVTGELDQQAILDFVGTNQYGYIKQWYDQNGSGNTLGVVNSASTRQPLIVNNRQIVTKDGKLALLFGGPFSYLVSNTISVPLNRLSIFVVCSNNGSGTSGYVEIGTTQFPKPNQTGSSDQYYYNGANRINLGPTNNSNKVYSSLSTATSISAWKNNVSVGSPVLISNTTLGTSINIGSKWPDTSNCTIQEILFYNADVLSRTAITTEIMNYYSITP